MVSFWKMCLFFKPKSPTIKSRKYSCRNPFIFGWKLCRNSHLTSEIWEIYTTAVLGCIRPTTKLSPATEATKTSLKHAHIDKSNRSTYQPVSATEDQSRLKFHSPSQQPETWVSDRFRKMIYFTNKSTFNWLTHFLCRSLLEFDDNKLDLIVR